MGWNQRRRNGIKRADFQIEAEDSGSERAITAFLGISFNNSELRDGKLSISGFVIWCIFDGKGSKIYERNENAHWRRITGMFRSISGEEALDVAKA